VRLTKQILSVGALAQPFSERFQLRVLNPLQPVCDFLWRGDPKSLPFFHHPHEFGRL
jgi:hypothetical protein